MKKTFYMFMGIVFITIAMIYISLPIPISISIGFLLAIFFAFLKVPRFAILYLGLYTVVEAINVWIMNGRFEFIPNFSPSFAAFWATFTISAIWLRILKEFGIFKSLPTF